MTLEVPRRTAAGHETVHHHRVLRGLEPDTRYRYRVRHKGGPAVTGSFRTGPRPAPSLPARWTGFGELGYDGFLARLAPEA